MKKQRICVVGVLICLLVAGLVWMVPVHAGEWSSRITDSGSSALISVSAGLPMDIVAASGFFSLRGLEIAFLGACVITFILFLAHNAADKAPAYHYEVKNSFHLNDQRDIFSHKNVTSRKIEKSK